MRGSYDATPTCPVAATVSVRRYALGAAALAAASAAIPGPLGVLLDISGLDPVGFLQRRMLRNMSPGGDEGFVPGRVLNRTTGLMNRASGTRRTARTLVEPAARLLVRIPVVRLLGRQSSRMIPALGAITVAVLAYRETHSMALAREAELR